MSEFILYATPFSLYSGKARSYLIKQHIEFEERSVGDPAYATEIAPVIGRRIIPVMQTPDATIVQDGTDIIDWFESRDLARQPAYPRTPRQHIVSLILEMFGGEGLLRPAMHYRWNFDEANLAFLQDQFGRSIFASVAADKRGAVTKKAMDRMRMAGAAFGAVPDAFAAIESAYEELLIALNEHFMAVPYLLGGAPTIGDYGMIAPLFAHLGRDPHPAALMKRIAPAVFRWTERMNARGDDFGEFIGQTADLLGDDALPATLMPVLKLIARDYLPEVRAFVAFTNTWLTEQEGLKAGDIVGGAPQNRFIGMCSFDWSGLTINAAVVPYRLYLLQRIQDAFMALGANDQALVRSTLEGAGLVEFLDLKTTRRVERRNHAEVWA